MALTKQRDAVAGAMRGSLLVTTRDSLASYILPEGEYAAIPASSMGVPPQERPATEPAAPEPAAIIREIIPEEVVQRRGESGALPLQLRDNINRSGCCPYPEERQGSSRASGWKLSESGRAFSDANSPPGRGGAADTS